MRNIIQNLLNSVGLQIRRFPDYDLKRRFKLINNFQINKIFDIGANVGDYALEMRKLGFNGQIISFEPLSTAFEKLKKKASKDKNWEAINIALGDIECETEINVAGNSYSSSLVEMMQSHLNSAPQSAYIGKEKIKVNKLDLIFENYYNRDDNIFVKIDTQGYEMNVLKGGEKSLSFIRGIQIELSLVQLYTGSLLYMDMIEYIEKMGFHLFSIENGFTDPKTGELLQMDGIFFRK